MNGWCTYPGGCFATASDGSHYCPAHADTDDQPFGGLTLYKVEVTITNTDEVYVAAETREAAERLAEEVADPLNVEVESWAREVARERIDPKDDHENVFMAVKRLPDVRVGLWRQWLPPSGELVQLHPAQAALEL